MARLSKTSSKASKAKARKASQTKGRKTAKTKRHAAPAAKPRKRRSVSELEAQLQRRAIELNEALEQQAATAEILKIINTSQGNLTPVFDIILEKAHHLCDVTSGSLQLLDGEYTRAVAVRGMTEPFEKYLRQGYRVTKSVRQHVDPDRVVQHIDLLDVLAQAPDEAALRAAVDLGGIRSFLTVPLVKDGTVLGRIVAARKKVQPFTDKQIALLKSFAAQAVIAIENARLFNETKEALARQTATSEILRVISQSPTDVRPVFDAIVLTAVRLFRCDMSFVMLCDHTNFWVAAAAKPAGLFDDLTLVKEKIDPNANFPSRAIVGKQLLHLPDWSLIDLPEHERQIHERIGVNSALYLPLLREGDCIGLLTVGGKQPNIFGESEIALAESFRDQALIAIENTRLFNETKEALEHQTATSEVLQVISGSMADAQPVFERILESIERLFDFKTIAIFLAPGDGLLHLAARRGLDVELLDALYPMPMEQTAGHHVIRERRQMYSHDVINGENVPISLRRVGEAMGNFSSVITPLFWQAQSIGTIAVTREPNMTFSAKELHLLQTFADQAVIAIENARLFDEVQAKTRDLTESLQFQTATSDVLKVISRSPDALQPVLDVIVETSHELCGSDASVAFLLRDGKFHLSALSGTIPPHMESFRTNPQSIDQPSSVLSRAAREKRTRHYPNILDDPEMKQGPAALGGPRALLVVPLVRDNEALGVIVLRQSHLKPFTPRQIQAIETFADQAVIAISNVGLFEQVQQRTRDLTESLQQQTATADVLQVISRSAFDLNPVFETVAESSVKLCGSERALIFRFDGELLRVCAAFNAPHHLMEWLERNPVRPGRHSVAARAALERRTIHVRDVRADQEHTYGAKDVEPFRTVLGVPMLKGDDLRGVILVYHNEVRPFTEKQMALVETFADQAVIAIENVRLFDQVQARTRELSQSLEDLKSAQDRLVHTEKLASLGQLTAGIAHEIKNPLNFVNNFSALSAELIDELDETLAPAPLDQKMRGDVGELTQMLKSNLEKVVQHGKRADSIVKNMLLHSREGSGEHRSADINALIEESLNLAYHGARAEKPGFNVTLQRDFDAGAGTIELFPQEITRAFLNLISNGFYAATKRKTEKGGSNFDPVLCVTTKNLGDSVQIRIRDNGTGIPTEVKEKIFNPFFTTKPAGEGTGLGLSMSHDIIVKQHGGRIDVDTEPGKFTEFTIVLPRTGLLLDKKRGQT